MFHRWRRCDEDRGSVSAVVPLASARFSFGCRDTRDASPPRVCRCSGRYIHSSTFSFALAVSPRCSAATECCAFPFRFWYRLRSRRRLSFSSPSARSSAVPSLHRSPTTAVRRSHRGEVPSLALCRRSRATPHPALPRS